MVTERAGREFLLTRTITFFEQFIILDLNIIMLVQLWVAGERPTIE